MKLSTIIPIIHQVIKRESFIKAGRIYGSSLYLDDNLIDVDIAIVVPSICGIVKHSVYKRLFKIRKRLCNLCGVDIDLIPHTIDEVIDTNSPLWHPRYNPSLIFGKGY